MIRALNFGGGSGNGLGMKLGCSLGCMLLECSSRIRTVSKITQMTRFENFLDIKDGNIIP